MYTKRKKLQQHDLIYNDNIRNDVPKRGYYSELVADMSKEGHFKSFCAKKRMKLILQVKKQRVLNRCHWIIRNKHMLDFL